jgi:transposase
MSSQNITGDCLGQEPVSAGIVVPLDLPEFRILTQKWQGDGSLEVEVIGINKQATCPHCGRLCAKVHDTRLRRKRDVALGEHRVVLVVHKRRFKCFGCRRSFTEPDQACGRSRRTTQRLRQAIGQEAMRQPIAQVASTYQVGPRFVQACLETVAQPQLARRGLSLQESGKLPTPRYLGIDEFARRKGHRYDTILCDLEKRQVLEVSLGRKQEDVIALLERLEECEKVEAVSMDMSETFRGAVQLCLPKARIVADHFHVIQHINKALKAVIARHAKQPEGKQALERQSALFLRNRETLSVEQEQSRANLAAAFPEIGAAWQLKEELRHWYASATKETAAKQLDSWIAAVKETGPKELRKALSAFRNWRREILAFFDFLPTRLSNGFVEGKNNRTKALMRQGYGYRNHQHLRLRILLEVA